MLTKGLLAMAIMVHLHGGKLEPLESEEAPVPPPIVSAPAPKAPEVPELPQTATVTRGVELAAVETKVVIPLPPPRPKVELVVAVAEPKEVVDMETVDAYLYEIYLASEKIDAGENFDWKDPVAAIKMLGMKVFKNPALLRDYVIEKIDPPFRVQVYKACMAADAAGLKCGITSGFRDDYRQGIAIGKKAAKEYSYHGGSRRGGYGRAVDLTELTGRKEALYAWIDKHGKEFGVGRPYGNRDAPHVTPITSPEYIAKRGPSTKVAKAKAKPKQKKHRVATLPHD